MIIFKQASALQKYLLKLSAKYSIGFVPTMGALHDGHISLINNCKNIAGVTVSSIFINPTQFNNPDDYKKYPVKIEQDIYLLEKTGCDILFLPDVEEIYPADNLNNEHFDLGYLENILEGKYRPGHFQGVCMVVKKLLQIVNPTYLFAGQKDYQQCLVLKKLLQLISSPTELIICPTTREKDGLAMSSRNLRLSEAERKVAPEIYSALSSLKQHIKPGSLAEARKAAVESLIKKKFKVDYIEIAKANDLQIIDNWNGVDSIVILAAVYLNNVRLIDNLKY